MMTSQYRFSENVHGMASVDMEHTIYTLRDFSRGGHFVPPPPPPPELCLNQPNDETMIN